MELRGLIESIDVVSPFSHFPSDVAFYIALSLVVILIFQMRFLYTLSVCLSVAEQVVHILKALFLSMLGLVMLSFFFRSPLIVNSRMTIGLYFAVSAALLFLGRVIIFRSVFLLLSSTKFFERPVLIVGAGVKSKLLAANIKFNNIYGLRVIGFVDDQVVPETIVFGGLFVLGNQQDIPRLVQEHSVVEILICLENSSHDKLLEIIDTCYKTSASVKIASPLFDIIPSKVITENYGNIPVVGLMNLDPSEFQLGLKRLFDIVLSTIGVILWMPIFFLVAILIKLDSPGPIIFRQTRLGKNAKPFSLFKFRSMLVGSDADTTREKSVSEFIRGKSTSAGVTTTKIVDESRVTRIGKLIRKTSIDEMPQLFNVLVGDMSLVGPRPCLPYEWEHYEEWHKKRSTVTPGCTGVWQVSGRSEVGFEDMVILDLYYVYNSSLTLDFQIMLKTIPVMIFGKGAK